MKSKAFSAERFEGGECHHREDHLTLEAPLQITINERPFSVTMRTPGDDLLLVKGLLFTEGIVIDEKGSCRMTEARRGSSVVSVVNVSIPDVYLCKDVFEKRSLLATSSCGMCGQREFDAQALEEPKLKAPGVLDIRSIPAFMDRMRAAQTTFRDTGSTHAAAAFSLQGDLIALFEDIGRHNAVDKVVGFLLEEGRLKDAAVLAVSGRISFEIVSKARRAGIPFLLAVSAPSSLAVEMGERWGMTLIGFCRDGRATVYSNPQNVGIGVVQ